MARKVLRHRLWIFALLVTLLVSACAPATAPQPTGPAPGASNPAAQPPRAQGPKRIVWAMDQRVEGFTELFGGPASGWRVPYQAVHDFLIVLNDAGEPVPRLAVEGPSQANGTWKVNPDGTMETTWKLRPGVTWHNGEPLRPEDFVLGWRVARDTGVPYNKRAVAAAIDRIEIVDQATMVFHWRNLYPFADRIQQFDLDPFPSWNQGLVDLFETSKADFPNHPWLTREFVGLGPYRVTAWDPGTQFTLEPFDRWYGGRAKIDRIEVRFVGDDNTRLAGILAGDIDVTLANSGGPDPEQWETIVQQYERAGMGQLIKEQVGRLTYATPKWTNPLFGGNDKAGIRQAMTHALDRESLAELMVKDRSLVSHSWIQQGTPLYESQRSKIVVYPYDPTRATALFQESGWTRGADGVLQNAAGERFQFELFTGGSSATAAQVMQDDWKKLGVDTELSITPAHLGSNLEYQASFPGIQTTGNAISFAFLDGRFHSRNISRPENRWGGQNRAAYNDPAADRLVEQILSSLDRTQRWNLEGDLASLITRNAVFFWMYHPTGASTAKKGITGIKPNRATGHSGDLLVTWNIAEWDIQG
jgi:peptide/nickel transport system substrate-binding protein